MDSYVCDACNKTVHCSNRVVHSLRCQGVSQAEVQPRPVDKIPSVQRDAHTENFHQTEQSLSLEALNQDEGISLPYCECPRCTYHNDVGVDECSVCGFNFFGTEERPHVHSQNGNHGGGNCTPSVTAGGQWECASCTYENEPTDRQCQVCHNVRPPQQSYSERLLDDDDNHMNDAATGESSAAYAWTSAPSDNTSAEAEDFPHSIASSMLLGAGIGAGLAWLNRSDVSSGALAGAGIGAASDMALREISAAQRMRQAQLHQRRMMEQQFGANNYPPVRSFQGDEDVFGSMHRSIAARRAAPGSLNTDGLLMQAVLSSLVARRAAGVRGGGRGEGGGALEMDIDSMPFEALLERFPAPPRGVDPATLSALPVRPFVEPSAPPATPAAAGGGGDSSRQTSSRESENGSARTCSICMEQYAGGEEVKTLPCLHCFHSACVDHWLREHHTCPVCKHSLA